MSSSGGQEDLYAVLGITPKASKGELKKAYLLLAKKYHPDRNPSGADRFKIIKEAYEILLDDEKRSIYDRYGHAGLKRSETDSMAAAAAAAAASQAGINPADEIFAHFFGSSASYSSSSSSASSSSSSSTTGRREGPARPIVHPMKVGLELLYTGGTKRIRVNRDVPCQSCEGSGARPGATATRICPQCHGHGVEIVVQRLPIGNVQTQQTCSVCCGQTRVFATRDLCPTCKGSTQVTLPKEINVYIARGMKDKENLTYTGDGHHNPGYPPSDVVIVLQEKPHDLFIRRNDDLFVELELTIGEALCGFSKPLIHLDQRTILIKSRPGQVVQPQELRVVAGEGMPKLGGGQFDRGDLLVRFKVVLPPSGSIAPAQAEQLATLLSSVTGSPASSTQQHDLDEYETQDYTELRASRDLEERLRRVRQKQQQQRPLPDPSPSGCTHQ